MSAFPQTRAECLALIAEAKDAIAAIKAQIAAADLDRQAGKAMDARWFHRAKTALRHKQHELDLLTAHLAELPARDDRLRDKLIEVARENFDEPSWRRVLDEAHRRLAEVG